MPINALPAAPEVQIARLQKRLERERQARQETETIAEKTLAELYLKQHELQARQEDLGLIQAITIAANEADTLEDALRRALPLVCRHMDWPVGHAWNILPQSPEPVLTSTRIWHLANSERFQKFQTVTEQTQLVQGEGLPGHVWLTGEPYWIEDLATAKNFPRLKLCPDLGLVSGLAFPIMAGAQVVAVLEAFHEVSHAPNPRLLETLMHIGTQLGRVVERERSREAIRWQAYHDPLTTLPNRTLFQDRLDQVLSVARQQAQMAAVLFLDLDRFKQVNDTLGHATGDRLLQQVASRLQNCLAPEDTLARMGGDEFTAILPGLAGTEDALMRAQKMLEALAPPLLLEGQELFVSGSIGLSIFPQDGQDAETLLRHADTAMYRSKAHGGGCQLFTREMDAVAQERLMLENQLRHAVDRQELTLFYQPQVCLATGEISGVEALLRWQHPTLGLIPPARFIPLAEETGLILSMGAWVLEEATRCAARWRMAGRPIRVAVNLSARQFDQPDLVESVARALDISGLPPDLLELEMTESVIMARGDTVEKTLCALKSLGVRLAIDDFGTGYSSLAYLRRFPVDVLKVDKAFVRELVSQEVDAAIVRAIIDLAHAIGLEVVAEGVETQPQSELLTSLKCDVIQGYVCSPALPEQELQHRFLDLFPARSLAA